MRKKIKAIFLIFFTTSFALLSAQNISVSGTVADESGTPLPGVTILVKGTKKGTATDFNGKYKISVAEGSTLVISSIGYKKQEQVVSGSTLNITMVEDASVLGEVMITAEFGQ